MRKVIIADDDFIVRTYLKQMLDWEQHGFMLYDAKNGKEALDICRKEQIDTVVTDMSMPVMDGMELIKALKRDNLPCHIIVLSCHDDFIYVKEAMKLGAEDYLRKNDLTADGLLEVLQKLTPLSATAPDKSSVSTEELAQIGRRKLQNDFFTAFADSSPSSEKNLLNLAKQAQIHAAFATGCAMLIKLTDWQNRLQILENDDISAFRQAFREMCQNIFQNNEYNLKSTIYIFQPQENGAYWGILINFAAENSRSRLDRVLRALMQKITLFSQRYFNLSAVCAVSDIQTNLPDLKQHWLSLYRINDLSFYTNGTIFTEADFAQITVQIPENLPAIIQELPQVLNQDDTAFNALQQKFLAAVEQSRLSLNTLSVIVSRLNDILKDDLHFDFNNFAEFKEQFIVQLSQKRNALKQSDIAHPAIRLAVKYIDTHYREALSQQTIADYVHLNPAYFSTLFKKSTGTNFSDYLINCRLNAVKKRLTQSSDKIKNIATEEGFADYQYFCKLFKKIVGVNPSEYRNQ